MRHLFQLWIALVAACLMACTDYVADIDNAHENAMASVNGQENPLPGEPGDGSNDVSNSSVTYSSGSGNGSNVSYSSSTRYSSSVRYSSGNNSGSVTSAASGTTFYNAGDLWNGAKHEFRVNTGLDAGGDKSGWWWWFADKSNGFASSFTWPADLTDVYGGFEDIIESCGGICGTVSLSIGTNTKPECDPYVGIGFNIAGSDSETSTEMLLGDVSEWGGICVTYRSDIPISMELGVGDAREQTMNYDIPRVLLPKVSKDTTICASWSSFKQQGWAEIQGAVLLTGTEGAKALQSLKFQIQTADGTTGKFNIISLGKYNSRQSASSQSGNHYDCSVYECITTEYLNQSMLAAGKYGEFLDTRDNQVYRTIKIGTQTWMAQNLNYVSTTGKSYCYSDEKSYCEKYGRLYTRAAISCPPGWHLPNDAEWEKLFETVGSGNLIASKGWSWSSSDPYGFAALPGGVYYYGDEGKVAFFHSATGSNDYNIGKGDPIKSNTNASTAISVRCIAD